MNENAADHAALLGQARAWLRARAHALLDDRLRGKVDPSDVAQEALLRAVRSLSQLRGRSDAEQRAWLHRILRSTLADLVRSFLQSRKRNVGLEQSLNDALQDSSLRLAGWLADGSDGPVAAGEAEEQLLWLAEGLASLPDDQRRAVRLRHLHGLAPDEIAREMGKSPAAVAGLLRRGLAALRQRAAGANAQDFS
jgi:RNA polymerase sigma-70 factor (ECF subfamily)